MSEQSLINKYRPTSFDEVVGHSDVLGALRRVVASSTRPHSFLFTGPSGLGKTTLARIVAAELGAEVTEIDAAANNGVDSIRSLIELGQHASLYGSASRMFILDEAHMFSRASWNALLKMLEEPPPHLYIAVCTTELQKVPETIQTRCYPVALRRLKDIEVEDLLGVVCDCEGWTVNPDVLRVVVQAATGQPRKALSLIQSCFDAPSREETQRIITLVEGSEPLIEVLRELCAGKRAWQTLQPLLERMDDDDFDQADILAGRFIMAALVKEKNADRAGMLWRLLDALVYPTSSFDKRACFVAAVGRMLWS